MNILLFLLCSMGWTPSPCGGGSPSPQYQSGLTITYEGEWVTVRNLRLKGDITCDAAYKGVVNGEDQWEGRFHGNWRGVRFSYDVKWSGPPNNVRGTATIDGARYKWTGQMSPQHFDGDFESSRYDGYFRLKVKR